MPTCEDCGAELARVTAKHRETLACETGRRRRAAEAAGAIQEWGWKMAAAREAGATVEIATGYQGAGWGGSARIYERTWIAPWAAAMLRSFDEEHDRLMEALEALEKQATATLRLAAASRSTNGGNDGGI